MTEGVFVSMDFNLPTREKAVFHSISEAPLCEQCCLNEPPFFNMNCQACKNILKSPSTTVSQIFAIMRQWAPTTQRNIGLLVEEAIRRGANVNDRDSLTDMTMLHYCAKAGSQKIGNLEGVVCAIRTLLHSSVDVEARCSWVDMTAIHFAALFNAPEVIGILVRDGNADQQALSREYDDGNALHIAARALSLEAIRALLRLDCDPQLEDSRCLKPVECMPHNYGHIECPQSRILEVVEKIHQEFAAFESTNVVQARARRQSEEAHNSKGSPRKDRPLIHRGSGSFATLDSLGLSIGDRVLVNRNRQGTLRFFGKTEFQSGLWAGVELEDCSGRNDGSVGNYRYFSCKSKYGIFCPPTKLLPVKDALSPDTQQTSSSMDTRNRSESGLAELPSVRPCSAASSSTVSTSAVSPYLEIGASVTIAGGKKGVIQFIGEVKFQNGVWIGVECNEPVGKHDGSVDGMRYFRCRTNHGVFVPPNKVFRDDIPPTGIRTTRVSTMDSTTTRRTKLFTSRSINVNTSIAPKTPDLILAEGMNVLYLVQRETGQVRYIGPTELGEGPWIGVEFTKPIGKSTDGKVNIRDYFKCKANYGLLIRPSKLTFRGINCHKIMPPMN